MAALLALGMMSCSDDDDDDPYNVISGGPKTYKIACTNSNTVPDGGAPKDYVIRGYESTTFKHTGGTVQITMNKDEACGNMGFIFDLKDNANNKGNKDFFIVGVNYKYSGKSGLGYYISKFENISDILAGNFGATTSGDGATTAKETEVVTAFAAINANDTDITDADGNISFVIDVVGKDTGANKPGSDLEAGQFKVSIYKSSDLDGSKVKSDATPLVTKTITSAQTGYDGDVPQNKLAVYGNVYAGKTLTGKWKFLGDYNCVEPEEE